MLTITVAGRNKICLPEGDLFSSHRVHINGKEIGKVYKTGSHVDLYHRDRISYKDGYLGSLMGAVFDRVTDDVWLIVMYKMIDLAMQFGVHSKGNISELSSFVLTACISEKRFVQTLKDVAKDLKQPELKSKAYVRVHALLGSSREGSYPNVANKIKVYINGESLIDGDYKTTSFDHVEPDRHNVFDGCMWLKRFLRYHVGGLVGQAEWENAVNVLQNIAIENGYALSEGEVSSAKWFDVVAPLDVNEFRSRLLEAA